VPPPTIKPIQEPEKVEETSDKMRTLPAAGESPAPAPEFPILPGEILAAHPEDFQPAEFVSIPMPEAADQSLPSTAKMETAKLQEAAPSEEMPALTTADLAPGVEKKIVSPSGRPVRKPRFRGSRRPHRDRLLPKIDRPAAMEQPGQAQTAAPPAMGSPTESAIEKPIEFHALLVPPLAEKTVQPADRVSETQPQPERSPSRKRRFQRRGKRSTEDLKNKPAAEVDAAAKPQAPSHKSLGGTEGSKGARVSQPPVHPEPRRAPEKRSTSGNVGSQKGKLAKTSSGNARPGKTKSPGPAGQSRKNSKDKNRPGQS
jgi:hypothetical protein